MGTHIEELMKMESIKDLDQKTLQLIQAEFFERIMKCTKAMEAAENAVTAIDVLYYTEQSFKEMRITLGEAIFDQLKDAMKQMREDD